MDDCAQKDSSSINTEFDDSFKKKNILKIPEFHTSTRSNFLPNRPPTLADDELAVKLQCLVIHKFKLSSDHFTEHTLQHLYKVYITNKGTVFFTVLLT